MPAYEARCTPVQTFPGSADGFLSERPGLLHQGGRYVSGHEGMADSVKQHQPHVAPAHLFVKLHSVHEIRYRKRSKPGRYRNTPDDTIGLLCVEARCGVFGNVQGCPHTRSYGFPVRVYSVSGYFFDGVRERMTEGGTFLWTVEATIPGGTTELGPYQFTIAEQ